MKKHKGLFSNGHVPWNFGKKMPYTEARRLYDIRQRGVTKRKPKNFSEIMRNVNPPKGIKIKYSSKDKDKKNRVWRKGYIYLYLPNHPSSRKIPPDYGYVREHQVVMEEHIGRQMVSGEQIHHIDGDKSNNKLENLVLCANTRDHLEIHNQMEIFVEKLIREGKVYYEKENRQFCFR